MQIKAQKVVLLSQDPVELLDLFPTLADLAGLASVPECPQDSGQTRLCTEGRSLAELVRFGEVKSAKPHYPSALSQYPRPSVHPQKNTDQPRRRDIRFMGYSLRTKNYRWT
jgi:iduronate 2-sulfatase